MQYHGFFWSAVIRALLSLRRDNGLDNEYDTTMLDSVTQIENEKMMKYEKSTKYEKILKYDVYLLMA